MSLFGTYKNLLLVEGILLFVQFWLGMSTNLFITVPLNGPLNFVGYSGAPEVAAHITNGVLVLAIDAVILGYGTKLKVAQLTRLAILGLVFVFFAILNGFFFTLNGQNDGFSMGMAISFLVVYTVGFMQFYLVGRAEAAADAMQLEKQN